MTVLVIHILFWNIVMSWFLVNGRTLGDRTIDLALTRKKLGKKGLDGLAGSPKSVKKLRAGDILVETSTSQHSELLLHSKAIVDIPIEVTPHATLNSSQGVIVERDLKNIPELESLAGFSTQGVSAVRRISTHKDGIMVLTNVLILIFTLPRLPATIKLDFSLFGSQNSSSGTYNLGLGVGGKLLQSKDDRIGIGVGVFMQQGVKPFSVGRLFSGSPTLGVGAGFNVKLGKKSNVNVGVSATKGLEKGPISTVVRVQYKFKRSVKNKK